MFMNNLIKLKNPGSGTPDLTNVDTIGFDISKSGPSNIGEAGWSSEDATLLLRMNSEVTQAIGEEQYLPLVKNADIDPIPNGCPIYIIGSENGTPLVSKISNLDENCDRVSALATQEIAPGVKGRATSFGVIHDIDTSSCTEGQPVYLGISINSLTSTEPVNPSKVIRLGICLVKDASVGAMLVYITPKEILRDRSIAKDPTGFTTPGAITVSYDKLTRKVTLTGSVEAYWRGERITALSSGWVSDALPTATPNTGWFLYYNGTDFIWSQTAWSFDMLMIAYVYYRADGVFRFGLREPHGLMNYLTHQELHFAIKTYLGSGGDMTGIVTGSTVAANRRPDITATLLHDEDNPTLNPELTSKIYSQAYLTLVDTITSTTGNSDIVPLSGNTPYWNQWNGSAWVQKPMSNNSYMSVWLVAMPVTSDVDSQLLRYFFVQGQSNGSLSSQQALDPNSVNMGAFQNISPEFVFIGKVILQFSSNNWTIHSVTKLTGTRFNNTSSTGGYLSAVSTNVTLSGNGTPANVLGVNVLTKAGHPTNYRQLYYDTDSGEIYKLT
jgi:hypothetical protein